MTEWTWPALWQPEAVEAVRPYVDADARLEILVGDPATSIDGTLIAGFVYAAEDGSLNVTHDHSGRPDVYSWGLMRGPVLRVSVLRPRRRRLDLYNHPEWTPRATTRESHFPRGTSVSPRFGSPTELHEEIGLAP